jgi:hypothetical protein
MIWHLLGALLCLAGAVCVLFGSPRSALTGWIPMGVGALSMVEAIVPEVTVSLVLWVPAVLIATMLAGAGPDRPMALHRALGLLTLIPLRLGSGPVVSSSSGSGLVSSLAASPGLPAAVAHHTTMAAATAPLLALAVLFATGSAIAGVAALRMRSIPAVRSGRAGRSAQKFEPVLMAGSLVCMLVAAA